MALPTLLHHQIKGMTAIKVFLKNNKYITNSKELGPS
jgi:hypothetical protein